MTANAKNMNGGVEKALTKAFLAAFLCAFSVIWVRAAADAQNAWILPLAALAAALLFAAYRLLGRCEGFVEKHFLAIAGGCALLLFALNVAHGYALRLTPVFDLGAIYSGATGWAATGGFMGMLDSSCDPDYFYYFPNNMGGMALLYLPIKLSLLLGAKDTFAAAMIFNSALISAAAFTAALAGRRMLGARQGAMTLACLLLMPPMYFMAPAFYTDSLSLLFPVLTLYLYLRLRDAKSTRARLALALLMGLCAGVGMLVKFTVIIALIAVGIGATVQRGRARLLPHVAVAAAAAIGVSLLFNGYIYANHLDKNKAEAMNTPYLHWVMMSLEGEGGYNPEDYEFTRSFSDPAERDAAIRARIAARVREKGFAGLLAHMAKKGARDFGDGTLALSDFLDDGPLNETGLHSFLLYAGEKYPAYQLLCTAAFIALQLMMISAAALGLVRGLRKDAIIPLLSVFGLMLFLVCWEVSARYVTNYLPMIAICAATGLDAIDGALRGKKTAPPIEGRAGK